MASAQRTVAIVVLALLVGTLVLAAVILLARGDGNAPIEVLLPTPEPTSSSPLPSNGTPSGQADTDLRVHISGTVQNPGVSRLRPGNQVVDAVAAAGGATADADLVAVNLARRVQDEEHYHIPQVGETPPPGAATVTGLIPSNNAPSSGTDDGLIALNIASVDLLDTLPDIGPFRAQAIVDYRERNGPFQSVEDIINVSGIGSATYEAVRDLVTVGGTP